ncbi:cytochrome b/b6 domain-containing protein [Luteibacter aegosomaticola]|nr:cytochrome b/b6 domain-containing protein [Luteibacter aegosomaticola]UPG90938.1 cytochrome b/b6 domain-containing protein [Luteibacter aegosomaticola]
MAWNTQDDRPVAWPRSLRVLHWLTVLCVIGAAALILLRDEVSGRALRMWLLEGHRHFGLLVLVLFVVRVVLRLRTARLPPSPMPRVMHIAAVATHVALYLLLLAMPLIGWAMSGAGDHDVHFFGLTLPRLLAPDDDLADRLEALHIDAAWALLGLVCLHIGAALFHHFGRRDGLLHRMWPRKGA